MISMPGGGSTDPSHVLVGLDVRRYVGSSVLVPQGVIAEAAMTWAGDVGSAYSGRKGDSLFFWRLSSGKKRGQDIFLASFEDALSRNVRGKPAARSKRCWIAMSQRALGE
jgi:hypothetical protein